MQKQQKSNQGKLTQRQYQSFQIEKFLNTEFIDRKVTSLPLQFQYIPVQILSKQYTKLNNPHAYRIHYLGPRFRNTIDLHKKYSYSQKNPYILNSLVYTSQMKQQTKQIITQLNKLNTQSQKNRDKYDLIDRQDLVKQISRQVSFNNEGQRNIARQTQSNVTKQEQKQARSKQKQEKPNQKQARSKQKQAKPNQKQARQKQKQIIIQAQRIQKYKVDNRKISSSYVLQQKLKGTQYFKSTIFYRAFEGMNPTLNLQQQYIFNSSFQSGNLDCVIKIQPKQFDLFLRIDSNTRGHLLWFYFSVKNNKQIGNIRLNICNFSKAKTLYKDGMKPYVFSTLKYTNQKVGWEQGGFNIGLERQSLRYDILQNKYNQTNCNCLVLQYDFEHQNDEVFFAYCIPYTYSQLCHQIEKLPQKYVQKKYLGKSLLGILIPLLHITSHTQNQLATEPTRQQSSSQNQSNLLKKQPKQKKKVVLITGRIHPSQSNSSHVVMGFIKWLCSEQKEAKQLRRICRFVVVPMVNPDGVVIGNSRTSAAGKDLNRQYINPDPFLYPQALMIKQLARKLHQSEQISLFLDFHGHSRKKNTFFYGPVYSIAQPNYYKCRILPKLIQKLSNPFRYHSCSFSIVDQKKKTARASMFQNLGVEFTYTVQSSIGLFYDAQKGKVIAFDQRGFNQMGMNIAKGTTMFVMGMIQYEEFLEQRRKNRHKKRKMQLNINQHVQYLQDQVFFELQKDKPLKILYTQKQTTPFSNKLRSSQKNYFFEMLQQLKLATTKAEKVQQKLEKQQRLQKQPIKQQKSLLELKDLDIDEDSDSHDQAEDMQAFKLNEFKHLVQTQGRSQIKMEKKSNPKLSTSIQSTKRKIKLKSNQDQVQLLKQMQIKKQVSPLRNIRTSQGRRKISPTKLAQQPQSYHKKTLPSQPSQLPYQYQQTHYQTPFSNNFKRPIYTSTKRKIQDKRQTTIANYFGQYRLFINQGEIEQERNKKKNQIVRRLQSRKERTRNMKLQSSNDIKSNTSNDIKSNTQLMIPNNHISSLNRVSRSEKIPKNQQVFQGPTQFTFQLPLHPCSQPPKSFNLKPKLKLNLRQRAPQFSQLFFHNKMSIQSSQKSIQNIYSLQQKQSSREKKNIINIQEIKKNYKSQQVTARMEGKCTMIDLNQLVEGTKIHKAKN